MRSLPILTLATLLIALPPAARSAGADPLRIETGFLFLDTDPARSFGLDFVLSGQGFIFVGEAPQSRNYLEGLLCATCSPVSTEPTFRLRFFPADVIDASSNSSCPGCGYEGDFLFETGAGPLGAAQPFRMTGTLTGFRSGSSEAAVRHQLIGSGVFGAGSESVLFEFAHEADPVPEPSTLLLLASGLGLAVRRHRSRRSSHAPS